MLINTFVYQVHMRLPRHLHIKGITEKVNFIYFE